MAETLLRWLHLSDFHTGKDKYGQRSLFAYILAHVEERAKAGRGPDIVFISGDLADKGKATEYEEFGASFLTPLDGILQQHGAAKIFTVPGNHDVDRSQAEAVRRVKILDLIPTFLDPTKEGCTKREGLFPRFKSFSENDLSSASPGWLFQPNGAFSASLEIRGIRVGVAGINTSWLCGGTEDRHELSPGKSILEEALRTIRESDIKIVVGHHPIDWLRDEEIMPIRALLGRSKAIYLHGHLHRGFANREEGAGHPFLALQAGAAFQAREDERWVNGMLWVEVDYSNRQLIVEPLRWSKDHQEWVADSGALPKRYRKPGTDTWIYPLPGTEPPANAATDPNPPPPPPPPKGPSTHELNGVFGRDAEIRKIADAIAAKPIVTVYGMSGTGKSELISEIKSAEIHRSRSYSRFRLYRGIPIAEIYRQVAPALGCRDEVPRVPLRLFGRYDFKQFHEFAKGAAPSLIHLDDAHHIFDVLGRMDEDVVDLLIGIATHSPHVRIVLESREAPSDRMLPAESHASFKVDGLSLERVMNSRSNSPAESA